MSEWINLYVAKYTWSYVMFSWLKKRKRSDLVCQLYTDKLEGNVDSILQWYAKKNLYSLV